jgi:hypothetical protein
MFTTKSTPYTGPTRRMKRPSPLPTLQQRWPFAPGAIDPGPRRRAWRWQRAVSRVVIALLLVLAVATLVVLSTCQVPA